MKKWIFCLAFLCVFLFPLYARAFDDGDWQYWNTNTIVGTLVESDSDDDADPDDDVIVISDYEDSPPLKRRRLSSGLAQPVVSLLDDDDPAF